MPPQRPFFSIITVSYNAAQTIGGFDLDFKLAMDYDSWAKLYQAGHAITRFDRLLVIFADGGFSSRNDALTKRDHEAVKRRLRDTWWKRAIGGTFDLLEWLRKQIRGVRSYVTWPARG